MSFLVFGDTLVQRIDVNIFKFRFKKDFALLTYLVPFDIFVAPLQH